MKLFSTLVIVAAVATPIFAISTSANAFSLTDAGDKFVDNNTGFVWKDIDQYFLKTKAEVNALIQAGNTSQGTNFQLATLSQVSSLFTGYSAASFPDLSNIACGGNCSPTPLGRSLVWGRLESSDWAFVFAENTSLQTGFDSLQSSTFSDLGAWVVDVNAATPIPTPAAVLPGLISMGAAALRKRREAGIAEES